MIKKLYTAILFLMFSVSLNAQDLDDENKKKLEDAVSLMDMQQLNDSKKMLLEILQKYPNDYVTNYELAYNYYQLADYKAAISQLNHIRNSEDIDDLYFQMLGNCYDVSGNTKKAIAIYKNGLFRFPDSGRLYLEWGTALYLSGKYEEAICLYEKGIEKDPMFPSNYYALTKLFCNSEEKVWGMLYGELFLNLERGSERTEEISELLYHTYLQNIKIEADTISISFSKIGNNIYFDGKTVVTPFGGIYESVLLESVISSADTLIDVESLNQIRKAFLTQFYKDDKQPFDNALFQYQKKVADAGHMDAYNHWVLFGGENDGWAEYNKDEWNAFIDWFSENQIKLDKDHKFYRRQYVFDASMIND